MNKTWRKWTPEEVEVLRDTSLSLVQVAQRLDRSHKACRNKAAELGVRRTLYRPTYIVGWDKEYGVFDVKIRFGDYSLSTLQRRQEELKGFSPIVMRKPNGYYYLQIKRLRDVVKWCRGVGWKDSRAGQQHKLNVIRKIISSRFDLYGIRARKELQY